MQNKIFLYITIAIFSIIINNNLYANVRYSVFINDFKTAGGSQEGIAILQDVAKEYNTEKSRNNYKKTLEKFIGENDVDIKCPYCYLEALEGKLVDLLKEDNFDEKTYNKILEEISEHKYNLAKIYSQAFSKMTKEDRIIASKIMATIFDAGNMMDKFKHIQKNTKHNMPIEPRAN